MVSSAEICWIVIFLAVWCKEGLCSVVRFLLVELYVMLNCIYFLFLNSSPYSCLVLGSDGFLVVSETLGLWWLGRFFLVEVSGDWGDIPDS